MRGSLLPSTSVLVMGLGLGLGLELGLGLGLRLGLGSAPLSVGGLGWDVCGRGSPSSGGSRPVEGARLSSSMGTALSGQGGSQEGSLTAGSDTLHPLFH